MLLPNIHPLSVGQRDSAIPTSLSFPFLLEITLVLVFHLGAALLTELRLPFQLSPTSLAMQLRIHGLAALWAELAVRERAAIRTRDAHD